MDVHKVCLVGGPYIGKTRLCFALANQYHSPIYDPTIGVEIVAHRVDDTTKLLYWDTAGHSDFSPIVDKYVNNIKTVLFCYSMNDKGSFLEMVQRYRRYKEEGMLNDTEVMVCMTQIDKRPFDDAEQKGLHFSSSNHLRFFKTSAVTGAGIDSLVRGLLRRDVVQDPPTPTQGYFCWPF